MKINKENIAMPLVIVLSVVAIIIAVMVAGGKKEDTVKEADWSDVLPLNEKGVIDAVIDGQSDVLLMPFDELLESGWEIESEPEKTEGVTDMPYIVSNKTTGSTMIVVVSSDDNKITQITVGGLQHEGKKCPSVKLSNGFELGVTSWKDIKKQLKDRQEVLEANGCEYINIIDKGMYLQLGNEGSDGSASDKLSSIYMRTWEN